MNTFTTRLRRVSGFAKLKPLPVTGRPKMAEPSAAELEIKKGFLPSFGLGAGVEGVSCGASILDTSETD